MRNLLPWMALFAVLSLTVGVHVSAQTKAPAKQGTTKSAPKKAAVTAKKNPPTKSSAKSTAARKGGKKAAPRKPAVTWRNRQNLPSADRYRDIQTALAAKGYLRKEDATGEWNQASIDALKRFQSEQSLEPTGKLNSLSLIALGLGPKYDVRAAVPPPAAPPQD